MEQLQKRLRAKTKVEVVRRGLTLLKEATDRAALRSAYRNASEATRASTLEAIEDFDGLSDEGVP